MKLFISHSWQDKTVAHQIAEAMGNTAEVWLDVKQLKAGDAIQPRIDAAMTGCDVIIVVWSARAAASAGVHAELDTAERLQLRRLPVLIDDTPLSHHSGLQGLYGIDLDTAAPQAGLMRTQAAIVRLMMDGLGWQDAQALNALTEFEGLHQYVAEYRHKRGIAGADAAGWALKAMDGCNQAYARLSGLRDRVGDTLKTLQDALAEVQAAGHDRARIAATLARLQQRPDADTRELRTLIDFVKGKLDSLGPALHAAAPRAAAAPAPDPRLAPVQAYIEAAPASLQAFTQAASATHSNALRQVAQALQRYLHEGQDFVPDDAHPVLGYIDDAWLIHNTVYRCVEAGLVPAAMIPVDWPAVIQADAAVLALLPPVARQQLEALLLQLMQLIAQEVQGWAPAFVPHAAANAYAAYMGGGEAVGGSQQEQTIDDVFYTCGGKMHYYGGR